MPTKEPRLAVRAAVTSPHGPLLLALAGAVLVLALPLSLPSQTFEETAYVVEVQVPVNVYTRDGQPVRGLQAEDFEVFDEGKRQTLTGFQIIDLEVLEAGDSRAQIEEAVPGAARRHFLLLFDISFSNPAAILKARLAARDFVLNSLHPTDLAAVAIHSVEGGIQLLVTFTPDRAQLARAIDTLGAPRLLQLARRDPLRFLIDTPSGLSGVQATTEQNVSQPSTLLGDPEQVSQHLRIIGKQMDRMEKLYARGRIASWSVSLTDLARKLDNIQGRKHVVYFSEGFDGRLLLGRQPSAEDREVQDDLLSIQRGHLWMVDSDDLYGSTPLQGDIVRMLEEFRRADCVIQAVDISGLSADSSERLRVHGVGQDALFYLANETGGKLFEDANNFSRQLEEMLAQSSVTYLLSFQPSDLEFDGSYHRLRIKVDTPRGARVSHRQGYYAPRPFHELHPFEKELLASDAIAGATPRRDLEIYVLAAPFRAGEGLAYVPVIIEVTGQSLLAGHQEDQLPVEIYTYVTDERGEMRDFFTQIVSLDLSRRREAFRKTGLKYYGHLRLGPGEHLIRVLVRNASTGSAGVQTVPLRIPAYEQASPSLLPPFFFDDPSRWLLVREKGDDAYQRSVIYPFTVNGQPYVPAARPILKPKDEAKLCLVAYNLGSGNLEVEGKILTENGEVVNGEALSLVERTVTGIAGLDKLLATFHTGGLATGRYTLQVAVTNPATGATETSSLPFAVVN